MFLMVCNAHGYSVALLCLCAYSSCQCMQVAILWKGDQSQYTRQ